MTISKRISILVGLLVLLFSVSLGFISLTISSGIVQLNFETQKSSLSSDIKRLGYLAMAFVDMDGVAHYFTGDPNTDLSESVGSYDETKHAYLLDDTGTFIVHGDEALVTNQFKPIEAVKKVRVLNQSASVTETNATDEIRNDISGENRDTIDLLSREVSKFKIS
jgi:hypothetical protein